MPLTSGPCDQGLDADLLNAARVVFADQGQKKVAVAVSGGGDSIALLHLMHREAAQATLHAVTVDHGLRAQSAAEALGVAAFCQGLGIPHTTLHWRDHSQTGNLMDRARTARTRLITDWAQRNEISQIALGHTADDQAETFLMGLARAAGLDGLAGMRSRWLGESGLIWQRPLLAHSRASLRDYLRRHSIPWVDDPTNDDDSYTRVKARKVLAALAPLGLTVQNLTTSISHLATAQQALQHGLSAAIAAHVTTPCGAVFIDGTGFASLPPDLQRRLLMAAIGWLSADPYPPRSAKQVHLLAAMLDGRDATLNGCRFRATRGGIVATREAKAVAKTVSLTTEPWDNRWHLDGPHAPDLTLRALGAEGLSLCKNWRESGISRDALLVSPGVWRGDALISAPLAGFNPEWTATIPIAFAKFVLSH